MHVRFCLPDALAQALKVRAAAKGQSVSQYVTELAKRDLTSAWPSGFFEKVVGGWHGPALARPPELDCEQREPSTSSEPQIVDGACL